jgi:hypothetical protein
VTSTLNSTELHIDKPLQTILRAAVGAMVPEQLELALPGADDPLIFADIVASVGPRHREISAVLAALQHSALAQWQRAFEQLDSSQQLQLVNLLRESMPEPMWSLIALIFECYYRDDRVMDSLQMDKRPAFPQGFEVEAGDWSLLDPVKKRAPFYRQV